MLRARLRRLIVGLSMLVAGMAGLLSDSRLAWTATAAGADSASRPAQPRTPLEELVAAERAFAAQALATSMRDAFVANLAIDAVVFRPLPANGLATWGPRPATKARLAWAPAFAEVSGMGDFGWTTGPWTFRASETDSVADQGEFLTVWAKRGGSWKAILDVGISHPGAADLAHVAVLPGPAHGTASYPATTTPADLSAMDARLSGATRKRQPAALQKLVASDVRYLHEGEPPITGKAGRDSLGALRFASWRPMRAAVASSGDLGFSFGVREDSSLVSPQHPDSLVYVHVWRLTEPNAWKLAAAVEKPLHPRQ